MRFFISGNRWILYCALVVVILLPVIYISLHSIPAADDFSNANSLAIYEQKYNEFHLLATIEATWDAYKTWQGTYFGTFISYLLSPLLFGGVFGVKAINALGNIVFYFSLFIFIRALIKEFVSNDRNLIWGTYSVVVFCIVNNFLNREIYGWYIVISMYIIPISMMLLMCASYLKGIRRNRVAYMALAAILGFLASGSSLNVAAFNCELAFLLVLYGIRRYRRVRAPALYFVAVCFGALINLLAPGNYIRRGVDSSEYNLFSTVQNTFDTVFDRFFQLASSTPLIIAGVILIIAFFHYQSNECSIKVSGVSVFILIITLFLGIVIIDFPVRLGYPSGYFPGRVVFVQDLAIYLYMVLFLSFSSIWLKQKHPNAKMSKQVLAAIGLSCLLFCVNIFANKSIVSWTTPYMYASITSGSIDRFEERELEILDEIEKSKSKDVVLRGHEELSEVLINIQLQDNAEWWVNTAVAQYYGKDSVVLIGE